MMEDDHMKKELINEENKAFAQRENMLKNVQGTFAIEGMILSEPCLENLDRILQGKVSYTQVLSELRTKYEKRA